MAVWTMHAPRRYVFVATDGPVGLFEFRTCFHLSADLEVVDEVRQSVPARGAKSGKFLEALEPETDQATRPLQLRTRRCSPGNSAKPW